MSTALCIIAHAPLASALKECVKHIFSSVGEDIESRILAYDIPATQDTQQWIERIRLDLEEVMRRYDGALIFTDILGATPSNIAHRMLDMPDCAVMTGVNLAALISAVGDDGDLCRELVLCEGAAHGSISSLTSRPGGAI